MKVIAPIVVGAAEFVSSSIPETPPAAWSDAATYGAGDTVSTGTVGGAIAVWESQQAGNLNHDPTLDDGTWWAALGTTYAAYDAGVTYAAGDIVLSASTHRLYESQAAGNLGNGLSDASKWIDIGPTNRWAMFDQAIGSLSSVPAAPISVVIEPAGTFNALALLDLQASSVRVVVTVDAVDIYDQTYAMADNRPTFAWYAYFFEPINRQSTLIVTDLPPTGEITIEIAGTAVGTLVVGRAYEIGDTLARPALGIIDYSRKETDDFGITTVVERSHATRYEVDVLVDAARVDAVMRRLAALRATPSIWIGDENLRYESLIAYGFYKDFDLTIEYPTHSLCHLTVESLT